MLRSFSSSPLKAWIANGTFCSDCAPIFCAVTTMVSSGAAVSLWPSLPSSCGLSAALPSAVPSCSATCASAALETIATAIAAAAAGPRNRTIAPSPPFSNFNRLHKGELLDCQEQYDRQGSRSGHGRGNRLPSTGGQGAAATAP